MDNKREFKRKQYKIIQKQKNENKRKYPRKQLIYYLKVTDKETNQVIGHAVDISKKGLMLTGENPITPESAFQLQMLLPEEVEGSRYYEFTATSKWCKKDENPNFYNTGFELNDVSNESIQVIKHLILRFCL